MDAQRNKLENKMICLVLGGKEWELLELKEKLENHASNRTIARQIPIFNFYLFIFSPLAPALASAPLRSGKEADVKKTSYSDATLGLLLKLSSVLCLMQVDQLPIPSKILVITGYSNLPTSVSPGERWALFSTHSASSAKTRKRIFQGLACISFRWAWSWVSNTVQFSKLIVNGQPCMYLPLVSIIGVFWGGTTNLAWELKVLGNSPSSWWDWLENHSSLYI